MNINSTYFHANNLDCQYTYLNGPYFYITIISLLFSYLSCLSLPLGGGIVGLGVLFSRRSVSRVILHKGGGKVTVCTQSPLGVSKAWHLTVPLNQVACHAHRQESPSFIPLKVKNHRFYFLLDKEGSLNNPKLFDVTVGAYRPL